MAGVRLRTKLLLSLLLSSLGLTTATLFAVRHTMQKQVRAEIQQDLRNSVVTFKNVQRLRRANMLRVGALLASLPTLKALMTTSDVATIQDASTEVWQLSASNLFVLADRSGKIMALHTSTPGFGRGLAKQFLESTLQADGTDQWWFGDGHLYEVFLQPIYFGAPAKSTLLGLLAVGYEVDEQVARDVSLAAASQVAFGYGNKIAVSTLTSAQEAELAKQMVRPAIKAADVQLGNEAYLSAAVDLAPADSSGAVSLIVLKSYDQATAFLNRLNRELALLGIVTVLVGGMIVVFISHTFTRPLKCLVSGVRSLERGDFTYPLQFQGDDEVSEVTNAFVRMRASLQRTHQQLLEAEQLATIGRMASSISHDLRHSLTAVLANSEFQCEAGLNVAQREELYQEIRVAVNQMTDLIESLLEFSRTRESLRISYGNIEDVIRHAVSGIRAHPKFQQIQLEVAMEGPKEGWFDSRKMERVLHNLLLNACEVASPHAGKVGITTREDGSECILIRVADNGPGIAEPIRDTLFHPFVSHGKENGTGLGLAVVQKIVQDHGGDVRVETTSSAGTVFAIMLPIDRPPATVVTSVQLPIASAG
jgi:signal transduction histidine kinase